MKQPVISRRYHFFLYHIIKLTCLIILSSSMLDCAPDFSYTFDAAIQFLNAQIWVYTPGNLWCPQTDPHDTKPAKYLSWSLPDLLQTSGPPESPFSKEGLKRECLNLFYRKRQGCIRSLSNNFKTCLLLFTSFWDW